MDEINQTETYQNIQKNFERILALDPTLDPDTVWHTLILLEKKPIERLRLGLLRGRNLNLIKRDYED